MDEAGILVRRERQVGRAHHVELPVALELELHLVPSDGLSALDDARHERVHQDRRSGVVLAAHPRRVPGVSAGLGHERLTRFDTGGGMSAENLSRVFEPYFTTKNSGSGLGLLIVRRSVREHGGEMAIESNEGKGLTLTIRLPFVGKRVRMLEAGEPRKAEGGGRNDAGQL